MPRTLVIGKSGQVASELFVNHGSDPKFLFVPKEKFVGAGFEVLKSEIESFGPERVVNCAAYTAVDRAEADKAEAYKANRDLPAFLAKISNELNFHLVHFSTEYVFDGTANRPYREEDPTTPLSTYGESKLAGEIAIQEIARSATILRTSWVYSRFGNNFVKTMLRLAKSQAAMRVVADQVGCPTWAADLAKAAMSNFKTQQGVELFHFSGEGQTTWHEFAETILKLKKIDHPVAAITSAEYPVAAKRPAYGVLDKTKIKKALAIEIPHWRNSIAACLEELN